MSTSACENVEFALAMLDAEETREIKVSSLEAAVDWINNNLRPDQVFDDGALAIWAVENGYVLGPEEKEEGL